ncbi:MerR family transcriptional regulator [Nocardia gamkensis]|uniref:MerR family transcriptional regulator n=1 Tax=Nocardia gamkensis TaxID=352869 RepID=UPI0037C825EE
MTEDTRRSALISIGELARTCGLPVRTIRFYCDEGILESQRSVGGHRMFDAKDATERLLLVRRLRALGLGLKSITDVLHGERAITEAIAAESARLDIEFSSLAWRRASLRAIEAATPAQRAERLALLAAAHDGYAAHDCLVGFWRRTLAPISLHDSDAYVGAYIPKPPADPTAMQVVAYAELTNLVTDPDLERVVRQQFWIDQPASMRDREGFYLNVGEVMMDVLPLVSKGARPRPGNEVDRYVAAHAKARGERDSPRFRERLLADNTGTDHRINRFWGLTAELLGTPASLGQAHRWLCGGLAHSLRPTRATTNSPTPLELAQGAVHDRLGVLPQATHGQALRPLSAPRPSEGTDRGTS